MTAISALGERPQPALREVPIDDMKNTAARAYKAWPDRLYLVGTDGNIAYRGGPGPFGYKPKELEAAIKNELAP